MKLPTLNTYEILIKSHCEVPDYEDSCEAPTFKEAAEIFRERLMSDSEDYWSLEEVVKNMLPEDAKIPYRYHYLMPMQKLWSNKYDF